MLAGYSTIGLQYVRMSSWATLSEKVIVQVLFPSLVGYILLLAIWRSPGCTSGLALLLLLLLLRSHPEFVVPTESSASLFPSKQCGCRIVMPQIYFRCGLLGPVVQSPGLGLVSTWSDSCFYLLANEENAFGQKKNLQKSPVVVLFSKDVFRLRGGDKALDLIPESV